MLQGFKYQLSCSENKIFIGIWIINGPFGASIYFVLCESWIISSGRKRKEIVWMWDMCIYNQQESRFSSLSTSRYVYNYLFRVNAVLFLENVKFPLPPWKLKRNNFYFLIVISLLKISACSTWIEYLIQNKMISLFQTDCSWSWVAINLQREASQIIIFIKVDVGSGD